MTLFNNNSFLDKKYFRCRKTNPNHEVKIPIRKETFLIKVRMNLISIYYFIFDCFVNNISETKNILNMKT